MRLQLALNVTDLEAAIDYYQRLFGVAVAKRKPGYANFEVAQPALKLVLFETTDGSDRLNHLGVETFADDGVLQTAERHLPVVQVQGSVGGDVNERARVHRPFEAGRNPRAGR